MANTWQGEFPIQNLLADGFEAHLAGRDVPPNGYGLYDMIGNVWEWTDRLVRPPRRASRPRAAARPIRDGEKVEAASCDPREPIKIPRKVMKGGSFLCAPNYCRRYRPAARMAQPIDTSTCHLGFRCVIREP